jgi:transposase
MFIHVIPNRGSPPTVLLRHNYREGGKVKNRTLANLTGLPSTQVEALRRALKGENLVGAGDAFRNLRSRPHGHVAAVLGSLRRLGVEPLLASRRSRERDLVVAMIVDRILEPGSKLAMAQGLRGETLFHTLGETLGLETADEDELYGAMDWLLPRQEAIEARLASRHMCEGTLVLYDVTSTYFEGRHCPLARLGHSRDGKKKKLQIVIGLLCNSEGCPVAVEVFDGNTGDPKTLPAQIEKIRGRFGLTRVVLVGDRGMITDARIREDLKPVEGLDWISCLRAPAIKKLVEGGSLQLSLFDERDLGEIEDPLYPGERLIVCRNPLLAEERARKRRELLQATEQKLEKIVQATIRSRRRLQGQAAIGERVGRVLARSKVGKHFRCFITEDSFRYERREENIAREAALDGIYVIRTSVPREDIDADNAVRCYKRLSVVERAFRSMKTMDLKIRPIYHHLSDRVRAHVLLCMLAYYVEWHMRRALAEVLFADDDPEDAEARRTSIVAPAQRSRKALRKASTKRTQDGLPVHSFQTLLKDLATIVKNRVVAKDVVDPEPFDMVTKPTPFQQRALDLLGVSVTL